MEGHDRTKPCVPGALDSMQAVAKRGSKPNGGEDTTRPKKATTTLLRDPIRRLAIHSGIQQLHSRSRRPQRGNYGRTAHFVFRTIFCRGR